jgi:formylglycine-generating enzyme required for sulfatase activity
MRWLRVASAFGALGALASCFPGYLFSAGGAPGDGGFETGWEPDASVDVATPETAIPETAPPEAGPPTDGGPPVGMVAFGPGSFDFVVNGPTLHATLDYSFAIDQEEVTVARFRRWVDHGRPVPCTGTVPCPLDTRAPYAAAMLWDPAWNQQASSGDYSGGPDCMSQGGQDVATYALPNSDAYPMTCVNWAEAAAFCWSDGKRLPTTTEWYYVATGAGAYATAFPWGSATPTCQQAILDYGGYSCGWPVAVGTAAPQIMGVYDLVGSVSEWTWDSIDPAFTYPLDATDFAGLPYDPTGGIAGRNSFWVASGYNTYAQTLDTVAMAGPEPQYGWPNVGFRCAATQ